jgi:hypothetical protein
MVRAQRAEQKKEPEGSLKFFGGPRGIRTHDQLIKSQLLYQLSYQPTRALSNGKKDCRQALVAAVFSGLYPGVWALKC